MNFNKLLFLLVMLFGKSASAQEISFDKKSGEFRAGDAVVAKLESEKVKSGVGKNYSLMNAAGTEELLSYRLHRWEDTFGHPTIWYYTIHAPALGYQAFRPNFQELNTFKEVGNLITAERLLQADGKLNEEVVKEYFRKAVEQNGNYDQRHAVINDSLMKLVNIPAEPVERDRRKAITANEYGKIGQGNVVIGSWKLLKTKRASFGEDYNYTFEIRNIAGGIVCVSHIELSGAHTYVFKDGRRSEEDWRFVDLLRNNPVSGMAGQTAYVVSLAQALVKAGLL